MSLLNLLERHKDRSTAKIALQYRLYLDISYRTLSVIGVIRKLLACDRTHSPYG